MARPKNPTHSIVKVRDTSVAGRSKQSQWFTLNPENRIALNSFPRREARSNGRILWILTGGDNVKRMEYIRKKAYEINRAFPARLQFLELNSDLFCPLDPRTKGTRRLSANYEAQLYAKLAMPLQSACTVVVNNFQFMQALLVDSTGWGTKEKLAAFRGSLYFHKLTTGLPTLCIDDVSKCYTPAWKQEDKVGATPAQCEQFLEYDLAKIWRFANNTDHKLPAFFYQLVVGARSYVYGERAGSHNAMHNYDSVEAAALLSDGNHIHADDFSALIASATHLAIDTETSMGDITCFSVSACWNNNPLTIRNFTVPLIDTTAQDTGLLWMSYPAFNSLHRYITSHPAFKVWANGTYDAHYHIKFHAPPSGPVHDVIHMWHSYRARMPKSLAAIASIFLDNYYYWKDEIKGGATEKKTQVSYAVPVTAQGLRTYWRYAALDTYATLLSSFYVTALLAKPENSWAVANYTREMTMQYGPLMKASYMGTRLDPARLNSLVDTAADDSATGLIDLRTASNSIVQTGTDAEIIQWLYFTLGATPPKQRKDRNSAYSVDQKQLQLVAEQHPIFESAIHYLRAYRKPEKRENMYGGMKHLKERFQYKYSIAGTYTGRLSGKASDFWCGTNPQNIPAEFRSFVRADRGMVMFDIDYSQADLYHFAVACGDKNMISNVFDDRDTHSVHVETILKRSYNDVIAGKKAGAEWVVHPITGVRQIIKKLTHGGNYGMQGPSAYLNAGRAALDAAAGLLGVSQEGWGLKNYELFIEDLLKPYFAEYAGQLDFRRKIVTDCIGYNGMATCFGGLSVYFKEAQRSGDKGSLMRALLAFYGQGGTAGMINEAIAAMYYRGGSDHVQLPPDARSFLDHYKIDLLLQTHDSITYQCPIEALVEEPSLLKYILNYMEIQCNFNQVEYVVPCEVQIGSRWSKKMNEIKRTASSQDMVLAALDHFIYEGDLLNP